MPTKELNPTDLLDIAESMIRQATKLKEIAQGFVDDDTSPEKQAILALTPTARKIVSFLLTEGGTATYGKACKALGVSSYSLGNTVGWITRRQVAGLPPVVAFEQVDKNDDENSWLVVLDPTFRDVAWELELANGDE